MQATCLVHHKHSREFLRKQDPYDHIMQNSLSTFYGIMKGFHTLILSLSAHVVIQIKQNSNEKTRLFGQNVPW